MEFPSKKPKLASPILNMESVNKNSSAIKSTDKPLATHVEEFFRNPDGISLRKEQLDSFIENESLLTYAVKNRNNKAAAALLSMGAKPDMPNKKGVTPISAAAHIGNIDVMMLLLRYGASVNAANPSGSTALIQASHFGHVEAVKLLLENKATADYHNTKGTTALMRASQEGNVEISHLLIKYNADVNRKNLEGMNALMLASQRGHANVVLLLIKAKCSIDEQTQQGSTALMLACKRGHEECVKVLVGMGAEIFIKDNRGRTARETATRRNHIGLLQWLDTQAQFKLHRQYLHEQSLYIMKEFKVYYDLGRLRLENQERNALNILLARKRLEYIKSFENIEMSTDNSSSSNSNKDIKENYAMRNIKKIEKFTLTTDPMIQKFLMDGQQYPSIHENPMDSASNTVGMMYPTSSTGLTTHATTTLSTTDMDVSDDLPLTLLKPQSLSITPIQSYYDHEVYFNNILLEYNTIATSSSSSSSKLAGASSTNTTTTMINDLHSDPLKLASLSISEDTTNNNPTTTITTTINNAISTTTTTSTVMSGDIWDLPDIPNARYHPYVTTILKTTSGSPYEMIQPWEWPLIFIKSLSMPNDIFEMILSYLPLPTVWGWNIEILRRRWTITPQPLVYDISILMDEILTDACIFKGTTQKMLLCKLNSNPQIYPHLVREWGMTPALIQETRKWADIQSVIHRTTLDYDISLKSNLIRTMLHSACQLFRWSRNRASATRIFYEVFNMTSSSSTTAMTTTSTTTSTNMTTHINDIFMKLNLLPRNSSNSSNNNRKLTNVTTNTNVPTLGMILEGTNMNFRNNINEWSGGRALEDDYSQSEIIVEDIFHGDIDSETDNQMDGDADDTQDDDSEAGGGGGGGNGGGMMALVHNL